MPKTLEGRQYLADLRSPPLERLANIRLAALQLTQMNLHRRNALLGGANSGGSGDERLIESAAVIGDGIVFGRKPLLGFRRFALLSLDRIELLIALLDGVGSG